MNIVHLISNLKRFPKPFELCRGGSETVWETVSGRTPKNMRVERNRNRNKITISIFVPLSFYLHYFATVAASVTVVVGLVVGVGACVVLGAVVVVGMLVVD